MRLRRRASTEQGSVLMLVPAGFLILVTLAALAVDSAADYLAQQQLHDSLASAANDAVTAGLSNQAFYAAGAVSIDAAAAGRVVCLTMAAQSDRELHGLQLRMAVNRTAIRLQGTATVNAVFGRDVPGFGRRHVTAEVQAVVTGHALTGPNPASGPAPLAPLICP
jgi:hypothetical protein